MADIQEEILHEIALVSYGLEYTKSAELIRHYGSAAALFDEIADDETISLAVRQIFTNPAGRQQAFERARREMEFLDRKGFDAIAYTSDSYPECLRQSVNAPVILFRAGRCPLDGNHMLGVVGTRKLTNYGASAIDALIHDLAPLHDVTIVSGLAYGADVEAHKAALRYGLPTIAVMAHGLDMVYPASHTSVAEEMIYNGGALITEFMAGTKPFGNLFLQRNRIVAGLTEALVVAESDVRGGSLATARLSAANSRSVFAFPGRLSDQYSSGTNRLIADNAAQMLLSAQDLRERMHWGRSIEQELPLEESRELRPEQQQVVDLIRQRGRLHIDQIAKLTGQDVRTASILLMEMTIDNTLIQTGDFYDLPVKRQR